MIQAIKSRWDQSPNATEKITLQFAAQPFYTQWLSLQEPIGHVIHSALNEEDKRNKLRIILETVHYEILDEVLQFVPEEGHSTFIAMSLTEPDAAVIFERFDLDHDITRRAITRRGQIIIDALVQSLLNHKNQIPVD